MQTSVEDFHTRILKLAQRFNEPLPGLDTFIDMAPDLRRRIKVDDARASGCREGAVLLLLYPIDGITHTVLTVRSLSLRNHAGQISLPGGRLDAGETVIEAALREAWEELAIISSKVELLGSLSPMYILPSNYCLTTIVAATYRRPDFRPHKGEVAELLEITMDHFVGATNRRLETWTIRGEARQIPFFQFGMHKIWGATGMILTEMAHLWESH
jgi:8-oxo-dGTP pyrophosphatase MutT (NUDIX family)